MVPSSLKADHGLLGVVLFDRTGAGADYEELHVVQHPASRLRAVLAIHSTRLGPAFGGIRRWRYATEGEAVADALRLAEGMSLKCALADLPAGGAKMVILDNADLDRAGAYRQIGRQVDHLNGRYVCGPDVGTTDADLDLVRSETDWVNPRGNDAGASTALGVVTGLRAMLRALDGTAEFGGHTFLVQGLGSVGQNVAATLIEEGATVLGADPDAEAQRKAKELGVVLVPPEAALSTPCDVFVPCALGGILTRGSVSSLRARAVCGSANNQLATPDVADDLAARDVLYAPDLVVNCGAVVEGFFTIRDGTKASVRRKAYRHIERIGDTITQILDRSEAEGVPTERMARRIAKERIRGGGSP